MGLNDLGRLTGGIYNPVGVGMVAAPLPRTALRLSWASECNPFGVRGKSRLEEPQNTTLQGTPQVYLPSTIARSHRLPGRTRQGAVASLSLRRSYGRIEHRHGPHRQERKTGQMKPALAGEHNQEYRHTGSFGIQVAINAGASS